MPLYLYKCLCGQMVEGRYPVDGRPGEVPCPCGRRAVYTFSTQTVILTSPLSLDDQCQREFIDWSNRKTPEQIRQWEREQQAYADWKASQPVRPSFSDCLDEARKELSYKGVDYTHPTL